MSDINKTQHYKTIRKTCYTANILYLILHVFYLVLFFVSKAYILAYVDIAAIVFYGVFFLLIKKKKYYLYALICGNLFLAFVSVTTVMLGFTSGFHFYLIALCVVSFFTTYFSKNKNPKGSVIWVILSATIYLVLFFVTEFNPPYYPMEKWLEITLFTTHAIVVFAFIAAYLIVFIKYAITLEKRIMNQSRTDELTKINNRYGLYDSYDEEDKTGLVLALFDIDDFKNINDKYGHSYGDVVLKRVADITKEVLKDSFVCRYGGEEFVVVIKDEENDSSYERLDDLRKAIEEERFEYEGIITRATITIGASKYIEGKSLEEWLKTADEKMYLGKNSGKNQVVM